MLHTLLNGTKRINLLYPCCWNNVHSFYRRCLKNYSTEHCDEYSLKDTHTFCDKNTATKCGTLMIAFKTFRTDGLLGSEIFEIGATCNTDSINLNISPEGKICFGHLNPKPRTIPRRNKQTIFDLTKRHGRYFVVHGNKGKKTVRDTYPSKEGLELFLQWINAEKKAGMYEDVLLVSHGDRDRDMPALINNMARAGLLDDLCNTVDRFSASMPYFAHYFKQTKTLRLVNIHNAVFPKRSLKLNQFESCVSNTIPLYEILEKFRKKLGEDFIETMKSQYGDDMKTCIAMAKRRIKASINNDHKSRRRLSPFSKKNYVKHFLAFDHEFENEEPNSLIYPRYKSSRGRVSDKPNDEHSDEDDRSHSDDIKEDYDSDTDEYNTGDMPQSEKKFSYVEEQYFGYSYNDKYGPFKINSEKYKELQEQSLHRYISKHPQYQKQQDEHDVKSVREIAQLIFPASSKQDD